MESPLPISTFDLTERGLPTDENNPCHSGLLPNLVLDSPSLSRGHLEQPCRDDSDARAPLRIPSQSHPQGDS